jgi:pimeloyl-ACP methyl ester carboxylesterase
MESRESKGIGFVAGTWPLDPAKPTLLFIHGSGGSSLLWHGQIDALASRANTVALDLPGRGRSKGQGMKRMPDYARVVMDFVDDIEAPRPIPCGLSLGGGIVQQLLLDYPDRFAAAVLIATGARLRVMPAILEGIEKDYDAHLAGTAAIAASPKTDPALLRELVEEMARCPAEVALGDFQACDAFDVMERLSEIQKPVLVISAEADKLTPPKYGEFLEQRTTAAQRVHLRDAGHLSPLEKPAEVNRAITDFLARIGPEAGS